MSHVAVTQQRDSWFIEEVELTLVWRFGAGRLTVASADAVWELSSQLYWAWGNKKNEKFRSKYHIFLFFPFSASTGDLRVTVPDPA